MASGSTPAGAPRPDPAPTDRLRIDDLPATARRAWLDLRDRIVSVLGDDLVAMWAHGGTVSVGDPVHGGDLDTYVILREPPNADTVQRIEAEHDEAAKSHSVDWDAWYVVVEDARRPEPPAHAWHERSRDTSWAIHRAHWLAGRYATLHGAEPGDIVAAPSWDELTGELDRELEHIERHVLEGDTDPYEATYALLTGSRILYSLATTDVAISKWAAGTWALEQLPARWHAALDAARRTYAGEPFDTDAQLLASEMPPFVRFVRKRLPPTTDRPVGSRPRWSGY